MANYSLRDNPLTEDPNDKLAQFEGVKSLSKTDILDRAVNRGNTMTRTDFLAAINAYEEEIAFITAEGNTVNTPLINTSLSISGVFTDGNDSFDSRRHTLKINVTAGTALKEAASKIKLTKVQGSGKVPWITNVRDTLSTQGDEQGTVKAGSVIELTGARLKFDTADSEQGVFFIVESGDIRLTQVVENKPSRIIAMVPLGIIPGSYTVEVRSRTSTGGTAIKTLKKGTFERTVTVTA